MKVGPFCPARKSYYKYYDAIHTSKFYVFFLIFYEIVLFEDGLVLYHKPLNKSTIFQEEQIEFLEAVLNSLTISVKVQHVVTFTCQGRNKPGVLVRLSEVTGSF